MLIQFSLSCIFLIFFCVKCSAQTLSPLGFKPLSGDGFEIFKPLSLYGPQLESKAKLLHPPEKWIDFFTQFTDELESVVIDSSSPKLSPRQRARSAYARALAGLVTAEHYGNAELSIKPENNVGKNLASNFDKNKREGGQDWSYLGVTMTGMSRINAMETLVSKLAEKKIAGGFMETGVWRGGSSIFARGLMRSYGFGEYPIYVCDSFSGLPPGSGLDKADAGWDHTPYLEISAFRVAQNFHAYGLLDENVIFVKGFFNNSIPHIAEQVPDHSLNVLRLDGDMYESTVDVLYHMYNKLKIGGYVIIDDWAHFPARLACEDFFTVHGVSIYEGNDPSQYDNYDVAVIPIDRKSVYWEKKVDVKIQFERYRQRNFKPERSFRQDAEVDNLNRFYLGFAVLFGCFVFYYYNSRVAVKH